MKPVNHTTCKSMIKLILFCSILPIYGVAQDAQKIEVRRVVIELALGQTIGGFGDSNIDEEIQFGKRSNLAYGNKFIRESDFHEETLKDFVCKSFKDKGVPVHGYDHIFAEIRENIPARYALGIVMNDLKFDYYTNVNGICTQFHTILKFQTTILDLNTDIIVCSKPYEVNYFSTSLGFASLDGDFSNYFAEAFEKFVDDMLADPEIKAIIYQEKKLAQPDFDSVIKLASKSAQEKTLIKSALESTVTIRVGSGHGSGAIVSPEGYILTCHHNINAAEEVEVVFSNGVSARAKVVRKDPEYDVALLKLIEVTARPLYLSNRETVDVGEEAWVIGTPGYTELGQSVSRGVISGKRIIQEKEYLQTAVRLKTSLGS